MLLNLPRDLYPRPETGAAREVNRDLKYTGLVRYLLLRLRVPAGRRDELRLQIREIRRGVIAPLEILADNGRYWIRNELGQFERQRVESLVKS